MSKLKLLAVMLSLSLPCLQCFGSSAAQERAPMATFAMPDVPIKGKLLIKRVSDPALDPALSTEGSLSAHPDVRWRLEGQRSYDRQQYDTAFQQFLRAARYADKPAQAMLGEMYWKGIGVAHDPELGYAWMKLAAERQEPVFARQREHYWNELDATQRSNAASRGKSLFAEYGDPVARQRLERKLRQASRQATGSRVGFAGNLEITAKSGAFDSSGRSFAGHDYYAPKNWRVEQAPDSPDDTTQQPSNQEHAEDGE